MQAHLITGSFQVRVGGGGVQAYHFGKKDFDLGVGAEGQDTSRHFEAQNFLDA